ncbi:isocitrate/isopropylmalate family dehydrogenase [Myxococcota bacterium]|jgi:isocitrate dehydrogenase (NAD+)|nr:isocitrate/isopropylmalate family dehydrogenase [Myxococcota bacterium]
MTMRRVTLIPGDGPGNELFAPLTALLEAAGARVEWQWMRSEASEDALASALPAACIQSVRTNGVALKGPMLPAKGRLESPTITLRKALGLYAGVRHVRNLAGLPARYQDVDLVVIRENTEDVYAGLEHEVHPGVVESIKVVTRVASERIFRFAYRYARSHGRQKLAIVHKANIMKRADGLFLDVGREVAADYPDVETRDVIVDNACMQLVQRPHQFQVLVCGNLYGDILSDLAAGLVGGVSAVWGMDQGDDCVVFEAIHGSAENPLPLLMPAIALLGHLGQGGAQARLSAAVERLLADGQSLPRDLGGHATPLEVFAALRAAL